MLKKPSDLFLSILEFFGILIPCAIFTIVFAAFRFMQLFNWCYALAFDLYLQIRETELLAAKPNEVTPHIIRRIDAKPGEIPS